jgi:hypothetical protein
MEKDELETRKRREDKQEKGRLKTGKGNMRNRKRREEKQKKGGKEQKKER